MEVLFDDFGFAQQVRNVLVDHLDQARETLDLLLELLGELLLLLVAPSFTQGAQLNPEQVYADLYVGAELLKALRELTQFFRVDNSLWHGGSPIRHILFKVIISILYSSLETPAIQGEIDHLSG